MIYSAGRDCPVCGDAGEIIFLKSVSSRQIFFTCYACGCACDSLPLIDCGCEEPRNFAPDGYTFANLEDIEHSGLTDLIADEFPDDTDFLFGSDANFIALKRNP